MLKLDVCCCCFFDELVAGAGNAATPFSGASVAEVFPEVRGPALAAGGTSAAASSERSSEAGRACEACRR
ncbi:hypothetical protein AXF42_Ash004502 [Apostasia shenzhenica]|uniref:Uncharacterized protein n=1 Tax=Apostasia shenzhenica TaxID=1088818 RepID=A0A2I0BGU9_9ASPA|nr:hypothetical protein AXF42_Ash004502 [Apostasia shenzhenica]